MPSFPEPIDWRQLKVFPLATRRSMSAIEDILVDASAAPPAASEFTLGILRQAAAAIRQARARKASVMLLYGAHLVKNGAASLVNALMEGGWVTHLGTNGAGSIHDWEFAFQNWSTESVEQNVATGSFGAWDETGRNLHLALMAGALQEQGYGISVGRFITDDGVEHDLGDAPIELVEEFEDLRADIGVSDDDDGVGIFVGDQFGGSDDASVWLGVDEIDLEFFGDIDIAGA